MNYLETTTENMGYAHPRYADSLREFGEPRHLPRSSGWILVRQIPGTPYEDAMGCYPVFACQDWSALQEDMALLGDLVSLTIVADPFAGVAMPYLERCFHVVRPFKRHYVADLSHPLERFVDRGHRYNVRCALKMMDVEVTREPARFIDDWTRLYGNLVARHRITGIGAFSRSCFEAQLDLPGMVMALGRCEGEIVGATLALIQGQRAYSHLSAYSEKGYRIRASYGLFWTMLAHLQSEGIRIFDLGAAPGVKDEHSNGLIQFKAGWSNDQRLVYLCGRIFDEEKYETACRLRQIWQADYFPAYRLADGVAVGRSGSDRLCEGTLTPPAVRLPGSDRSSQKWTATKPPRREHDAERRQRRRA